MARKVFKVYVGSFVPFIYDWDSYNYEVDDKRLRVIDPKEGDVVLYVPLDKLICIVQEECDG